METCLRGWGWGLWEKSRFYPIQQLPVKNTGDLEIVRLSQKSIVHAYKEAGENPVMGVSEMAQPCWAGERQLGNALYGKLYKVSGECVEIRSANSSTRLRARIKEGYVLKRLTE